MCVCVLGEGVVVVLVFHKRQTSPNNEKKVGREVYDTLKTF